MIKGQILTVVLVFGVALLALAEDKDAGEQARKLIPELGGKSWQGREKAQEQLLLLFAKHSDAVVAAVADSIVVASDPEIEMRLNAILKRMAPDHVRLGQRGFLGVSLAKLPGQVKVGDRVYEPVDIVNVLPATTAAAAGIENGERILSIDDINCTHDVSVEDVVRYISSRGPGGEIRFVNLTTDKKVKARVVILGNRPNLGDDMPLEEIQQFMMQEWLNAELRSARKRSEAPAKE